MPVTMSIITIESGSTSSSRLDLEVAGLEPRPRGRQLDPVLGVAPQGVDERDDGAREADEHRGGREEPRLPAGDPGAGEHDREEPHERREQADPARRRPSSAPELRQRVDVEREVAPRHRDDQPEPDAHLGRGDGHHGEREDLAVELAEEAREADEREVRRR